MPKSTKTFVLSTSQLNSHGFRAMTDGADLSDFIANPLMYWLHMEPEGKSKDEPLPIGFWEDIKVMGDEITAVPNFNDSDPFAMQIYNMVEHGTLRAASIEVEPIKLDANKKNWVAGQTLPTVTKWRTGEASIVDRGSNKGAIRKMKHSGKVITLADQAITDDFFKTFNDTMKIKLSKKASKHLKLAEDTELDATEVVDKLVEVIEEKETAFKLKEEKVTELEGTVTKLKGDAQTEKIKLMVEKAVDDRKILPGQKEKFIKLAAGDFDTTKELLDSMKGSASLENSVNDETNTGELSKLMKLSWDELFAGPGLAKLKALDKNSYKLKFKEKFGKDPAD